MRVITTGNFTHREIFALRGNIERMNDPIKDPYAHGVPGEISDGLSYLTQMGDESGMSGSSSMGGTRARKGFPRGTSSKEDEYDEQRKRDIPASDHMFISDNKSQREIDLRKGNLIGRGGNDDTFTDERERPVPDDEIWRDVNRIQNMTEIGRTNEGIGRINKRYRSVKERVKGAYK